MATISEPCIKKFDNRYQDTTANLLSALLTHIINNPEFSTSIYLKKVKATKKKTP
jgi:hypothetical protein